MEDSRGIVSFGKEGEKINGDIRKVKGCEGESK